MNWIQLSVILLSLHTDVSVTSGFMFIGIIPFELDDCLLYHNISAGGRDPHETHPRWYSHPTTRGWSSVMIFAPKGGTDNHLIVIHLIIRMHYLHIISNETQYSLGIFILLLEATHRYLGPISSRSNLVNVNFTVNLMFSFFFLNKYEKLYFLYRDTKFFYLWMVNIFCTAPFLLTIYVLAIISVLWYHKTLGGGSPDV